MSSELLIGKHPPSVEVLFDHGDVESSEEPPMDEWSSLIIPLGTDNPKRALFEQGLFRPGSGEICTKYLQMSASSVLRHPYYNYPGIKDPGILKALLKPEPLKIYDYNGQDLYMDLCEEMNVCPVRAFHRGLLETVIDLKYYGVNPVGVRAMSMALSNNKYVKKLDLTSNFLNLDACFHLGQLLGESFALQELILNNCNLQTEGVRNLVANLSKRSMETLDLSRNDIKDAGLMYLATQISKGAVIRRLNLSHNDLGVEGAVALAEAYTVNNKVTNLDISWNKIYPTRGANLLIRVLGDSTVLKKLNLSWNSLNVGVPLRKLLSVKSLQFLDLSNNKLTTDAANSIALRLPNATGLKTLDISNNPFKPVEVLMILRALRQKTVNIRSLFMRDIVVNKIFVAEKEEILRSRSKIKIVHGPVQGNFIPTLPDMRLIVMKRLDFITARATRKCKLDIGVFFLKAERFNEEPDIMTRELYRQLSMAGAPIDMGLIDEMAAIFPGKPGDKGAKTINVPSVVEFVRRLWPNKKIPKSAFLQHAKAEKETAQVKKK